MSRGCNGSSDELKKEGQISEWEAEAAGGFAPSLTFSSCESQSGSGPGQPQKRRCSGAGGGAGGQ